MRFEVNGREVDLAVHPLRRLLDVLREDLALTGTKEGCGEGECGACTVLVDDVPVNACLVPIVHVTGCRVTTVEGLVGCESLREAFMSQGGAQCGICTPGMIVAASVLPSDSSLEDIREALAGNLCRCTGYEGIYRAIRAGEPTTPAPMEPSGQT
jgi:aerobic-type carbon monoxide dehydrogenase small subunit (CoxS/CutS family)